MFYSKKLHELEVKHLKELASLESQKSALYIEAYEKHISQLQEQIADLRKMVFTPTSAVDISQEAREADAIISVTESNINTDSHFLGDEQLREFDAIMSSEHENF